MIGLKLGLLGDLWTPLSGGYELLAHFVNVFQNKYLLFYNLHTVQATCFQVLGCQPILHHEFFA